MAIFPSLTTDTARALRAAVERRAALDKALTTNAPACEPCCFARACETRTARALSERARLLEQFHANEARLERLLLMSDRIARRAAFMRSSAGKGAI